MRMFVFLLSGVRGGGVSANEGLVSVSVLFFYIFAALLFPLLTVKAFSLFGFCSKAFKETKAVDFHPQSLSTFSSFPFFRDLILNASGWQRCVKPQAHSGGASSLPLVLTAEDTSPRRPGSARLVLSSSCPGCSSGWCTTWLVWLKPHSRKIFLSGGTDEPGLARREGLA